MPNDHFDAAARQRYRSQIFLILLEPVTVETMASGVIFSSCCIHALTEGIHLD